MRGTVRSTISRIRLSFIGYYEEHPEYVPLTSFALLTVVGVAVFRAVPPENGIETTQQ